LVHRDGASGESSMYGILQSTANENGYKGNIKDITVEDVKAIYRKIWEKSGASSLPPALSVVHFDTYVNNPAMAKKLLNRSKGDINIYLKMREQQYVNLAEKRPEVFKRYLKGWKTRVDNLRTMIAGIEDKKTTKQT
ncbi:MAG: glycosyl hydrolase 108 family protein, partial [Pseudomonadota bacterium]|nr:glycosyl hydrolase 108 family protein [Pseudomonadota bacterium]